MENDNAKEEKNEPTTSKKESQSNNSVDDLCDESKVQASQKDTESDSYSYSMASDIDMAKSGPALPTDAIMKSARSHLKRNRTTKRSTGRVKKRERPPAKRSRRAPRKPKVRKKKERNSSVSTIFTRLSSSGWVTPGCEHCGHRCCQRRYEYEMRRRQNRYYRKKFDKNRRNVKRKLTSKRNRIKKISEGNQVGSRCNMLSQLFVGTNSSPQENTQQPSMYCEVTPEMIYEALRCLTMWKQDVPLDGILQFISVNYPVNSNREELMTEIMEKLKVAAIIGMVSQSGESWSLAHMFKTRKLKESHVTLFWKIYADTLKPVVRRKENNTEAQNDEQTSTKTNTLIIYDDAVI